MGPAIQDLPSLGARKKQSRDHESNEGMLINKNTRNRSGSKDPKPLLTPIRPSPIKLGSSNTNRSQKVLQSEVRHTPPGRFESEGDRVCLAHQQNRTKNAYSSSHWGEESTKDLSQKNQKEARPEKSLHHPKCSTLPSTKAEEGLLPSFSFSKKNESGLTFQEPMAEACISTPRNEGESVERLRLDFESLMLIKEDTNEDSGSDLSDSERIAIPASPFTPPDLILRAERIDPASFDHLFELSYKESEHYYPDILPPPFNLWDLPQLAMFLNTEGRSTSRPKPAGHLEKYVDRLLQLEWLQMQTVQNEKAKITKPRPHTAPSQSSNLKSPAKSRLCNNLQPGRMPALPENLFRHPSWHTGINRKQGLYSEGMRLPKTSGQYSKPADVVRVKTTQETNPALKKRATGINKQHLLELQPSLSFSQVQAIGNVRSSKLPLATQSYLHTVKGTKPNANTKKIGLADNGYVPVKRETWDHKRTTNGVKQPLSKR